MQFYMERPTTPREQIELSHRARTLRSRRQLETIRARSEAMALQPGDVPPAVTGNFGRIRPFARLRRRMLGSASSATSAVAAASTATCAGKPEPAVQGAC